MSMSDGTTKTNNRTATMPARQELSSRVVRSQKAYMDILPLEAEIQIPFLQRNVKRRNYDPEASMMSATQQMSSRTKRARWSVIAADETSKKRTAHAIQVRQLEGKTPFLRRTLKYRMHAWKRRLCSDAKDNDGGYIVHMLETNGDGYQTMSTRRLECYQCPLCNKAKGVDLEVMWLHCTLTHGDQYEFKPIKSKDGVFHLLVKQSSQEDSHVIRQSGKKNQTGIIYWRNRPLHSTVAEASPMRDVLQTGISPPTRQYYRDVTFHKIGISEWFFDLKDEDIDPEWQGVVDDSALCDLTDVSSKEKHLFSLWNAFMRKKPILSQIQLPSQLRTFVQEHSSTIAEHGLEEELIAHVTNMWVEGVIGRWNMLECMRIYNDFVLAQSRASP